LALRHAFDVTELDSIAPGARAHAATFARLEIMPNGAPFPVVATGSQIGESFDSPMCDHP